MKVDSSTVAVVTGGTGGIGVAVVDALRARGATVIAADLAPSPGVGRAPDVELDVTDLPATRAAFADVVAKQGRLDLVVACAGIGTGGLVEELDDAAVASVVEVNFVGAIHTLRAAYAVMIPSRRGHLVAIASLAGLLPSPLFAPYSATKAGLVGFVRSLRPEARLHGIGATVVCPGPVDTRMLDDGGSGGTVVDLDPRRVLTAAAGPAVPPATIGAAVVRGVERDTALVAPGRARVLSFASRLAPGVTERVVDRSMRKELSYRR